MPIAVRSIAYLMSFEVIARFTGGPNLMPSLILKVQVLPPSVGSGISVARSGTGSFPPSAAEEKLYETSVRSIRLE